MDNRILKWLYDNIFDENIWSIIINHVPKLKLELAQLISENSAS